MKKDITKFQVSALTVAITLRGQMALCSCWKEMTPGRSLRNHFLSCAVARVLSGIEDVDEPIRVSSNALTSDVNWKQTDVFSLKRDLAPVCILISIGFLCRMLGRTVRSYAATFNLLKISFQAFSKASIDTNLLQLQDYSCEKGKNVSPIPI